MRYLLLSLCLLTLGNLSAQSNALPDQESQWQKAYPAAEAGMKRIVIHLEAQKNESDWKVELIIGRTMETDGVNLVSLMGKIEERNVDGWGYSYFHATINPKNFISTRIGVDPNKPKVKQFVTLHPYGPIRYNSRLPIVVYIPEGHEVHYRFWKADPTTQTGSEG